MQRTRVDANARYKERNEDAEATGRREAEPHQDAEDDLHRLFSESDGQVIRLITESKGQKADKRLRFEVCEATDLDSGDSRRVRILRVLLGHYSGRLAKSCQHILKIFVHREVLVLCEGSSCRVIQNY